MTAHVQISVPVYDGGKLVDVVKEVRKALHVVGDWCVTESRAPTCDLYAITYAPTGWRMPQGYNDLETAKRFADAYAVVLAGIDPHAAMEPEEQTTLLAKVRDEVRAVADRARAGGDTQLDGAFDMEGS